MKKNLILIVFVIIFVLSCGYITYRKYLNCKVNNTNNESDVLILNNVDDINTNTTNNNNIVIEENFLSSIQLDGSDNELIKKNHLQKTSKFSIKDRLAAKNVAENFCQSIVLYDMDNPTKYVEIAKKYSTDDLKQNLEKECEALRVIKCDMLKKLIIKEVYSSQKVEDDKNNYINYRVELSTNVEDKYNQIDTGESYSYEVKVLKLNNEFKIINYKQIS